MLATICVAKTNTVSAVSLRECITNSQDAAHIITSAPCGVYGSLNTRQENGVGNELDVSVQYMVHEPLGAPRAVVMLFAGGAGNTGIVPDGLGGVAQTGNNFLVRSAQLFAEAGLLTITIDRPSTTVDFSNAKYDQYRVSPAHAQDIVAVLKEVNDQYGTEHLPVFLAGTSRGVVSILAQNMLGSGSLFSNPVTSMGGNPLNLWVGTTSTHARLQPDFSQVPVQVLAHQQDGCFVSTPADSAILHQDFQAAGVPSVFNEINGGFEVDPDACNALTYHGFLGVEEEAVKASVRRIAQILRRWRFAFPGNLKPRVFDKDYLTAVNSPLVINLRWLTSDPNGDWLKFDLPHETSSRSGSLIRFGSWVVYWPPVGKANITDGFVYRAFDGKGGSSNGLITVRVN